jgi:hypothetical protein
MSDLVFVPPVTPRRVRLSTYAGAVGLVLTLLGSIFSLIGWGLTAVFIFVGAPFWEDWQVDAKGVPAMAVPDDVRETSTSVNRSRVNEISIHFPDVEGIPHSATFRTADWRVVSAARERQKIPIHYIPGSPQLVRADGTKRSIFGLFALFPLAFALVGTGLLAGGLRGVLKRRWLYRWGTPTTGRVVSVGDSDVSVNGRRLLKIVYTFNGTMGPVEGSMINATAPAQGAEVSVLFDPNDPGENILPLPGSFPA